MYRNLIGNDNELMTRAYKSCMNINRCNKNLFHLYHPTSNLKKPSEEINRKMNDFTEANENHKAINKFLASKDLGNINGPLELTNKLFDEFFNLKII